MKEERGARSEERGERSGGGSPGGGGLRPSLVEQPDYKRPGRLKRGAQTPHTPHYAQTTGRPAEETSLMRSRDEAERRN
ncbi:hypothetical protein CesoFtcFv8_022753 [Champsocephalus esox]|uniref:Uncharacterized protein n=1 Tax=Champsocephalus esox TaxID=159716 RepID=A0AAN8B7Q5_9TELE|nr:hypothetical protein CesoFtcFv8_022753 [Champsocephalus esox]